jgi:hypothetical protein
MRLPIDSSYINHDKARRRSNSPLLEAGATPWMAAQRLARRETRG